MSTISFDEISPINVFAVTVSHVIPLVSIVVVEGPIVNVLITLKSNIEANVLTLKSLITTLLASNTTFLLPVGAALIVKSLFTLDLIKSVTKELSAVSNPDTCNVSFIETSPENSALLITDKSLTDKLL